MISNMQKFAQDANTLFNKICEKDYVTAGHCMRVAEYTENCLKYMGRPESEVKESYYAALLHDAGKLDIPDNILKSTKKFTDDERNIMNQHSENGLHHLTPTLSESQMLKDAMIHHHTSFNPNKAKGGHLSDLQGKNIPEFARIVAVFDVYDALSRARLYKPEISQMDVFNTLKEDVRLDQDIVKTAIPFIKQYEKNKELIETSQIENMPHSKSDNKIGIEFNKKIDTFLNDEDKHKYLVPEPEDKALFQWNTTIKTIIRAMPTARDDSNNKYDPIPVFDKEGKITGIEYRGEGNGNCISNYKITQNDANKVVKGLSIVIENRPNIDNDQIKRLYKIASTMSESTNITHNKSTNTINTQTILNKAKDIKNNSNIYNTNKHQYE